MSTSVTLSPVAVVPPLSTVPSSPASALPSGASATSSATSGVVAFGAWKSCAPVSPAVSVVCRSGTCTVCGWSVTSAWEPSRTPSRDSSSKATVSRPASSSVATLNSSVTTCSVPSATSSASARLSAPEASWATPASVPSSATRCMVPDTL